jgi:hypothetical protein
MRLGRLFLFVDRMPIRGLAWLISCPFGGIFICLRPKIFVQFLRIDDKLASPPWMKFRVK